ncbi:MAG: hypothetical protein GF308_15095 [Candidatus Heimdallarchaeota archaeon]|nr:hypothetical protein [Candidatus Heimdallarchaeota archaeon]
MLLDCYFIDDDGVETKVEPKEAKVTHNSMIIIISHTERKIYLFKGNQTSIRQKFAAARTASGKRLKLGYKIKHIEETEGIDDDFKPVLDFLGGIVEDSGSKKRTRPPPKKKAKSTLKVKTLEELKEEKQTVPKKKGKERKKQTQLPKEIEIDYKDRTYTFETDITEDELKSKRGIPRKVKEELAEKLGYTIYKKKTSKSKKSSKTKNTSKTKPPSSPVIEGAPVELEKVLETMVNLDPPEKAICDYLLVGDDLYIILGDSKQDLRKGEFKLERVSNLPEGVFPAENYFPRILVSKNKILGIELWKRT